jgi:putative transposase
MDKGYSCYEIHDICMNQEIEAVVPPKKSHKNPWLYNKNFYIYRNEVKRFFARIKNYRRIATRYDKLMRQYEGFVLLGIMMRLLSVYVNTA